MFFAGTVDCSQTGAIGVKAGEFSQTEMRTPVATKPNNNPIKPGTPAPISAQYGIVGPRGGRIGNNEVTAVAGKPLPPTPKPGQGYVPVDPTKHKR